MSTLRAAGREDDHQARSFQRLRTTESSVFSSLIEGNIFPTAICRLLSDMIDEKRKADCPFTCFEDFVEDLKQMICQSEIFLHNNSSLLPSGLSESSGRRYYGQEAELVALRNIVFQMEQSLPANPNSGGAEAVFVSGIAGR